MIHKEAGKILYNDIEIINSKINSEYYRLIPTRRPSVNLFERIISEDKLDLLHKVEMLTNPRVREALGETNVIKEQDKYTGGNRHLIDSSFLYLSESRFSNGTFGIFYAAKELNTALEETKYHKARFYAATNETPFLFQMSLLTGEIKANLHDIRQLADELKKVYSPSIYVKSQELGEILKINNSDGIVYNSVRCDQGNCFGVFKPNKIKSIKETRTIPYYWNGKKIIIEEQT